MTHPLANPNRAGNAAPAIRESGASARPDSLTDSRALTVNAVALYLARPGTAVVPEQPPAPLIQQAAPIAAGLQSRVRALRIHLQNPRNWSRRARMVLVLAFPVALPAWVGLFVFVVTGGLVVALVRGLYRFCAAPPKRRRRFTGYRYP